MTSYERKTRDVFDVLGDYGKRYYLYAHNHLSEWHDHWEDK